MVKRTSTLETSLAALNALRDDPRAPEAIAALRRALAGREAALVAKAAQIVAHDEIEPLTPDLVAAFGRLMENAAKSDPNCAAKMAIADALYRIGADEESTFLRGAHHVQLEPVWGGSADTAGPLRSVCALGLVRMNYREVFVELAGLLADPEVQVRAAAAQAIAYSENEQGAPLLRLKILSGDAESEVIGECMTALLRVTPAAGVDFLGRLLLRSEGVFQESVALALGGSRVRAALPVLQGWFVHLSKPERRRIALLAIAMLKHDEALEWVLEQVREANGPTARDAIDALAIYRHDAGLVERLRQVVEQRRDVDLHAALDKALD